MINRNLCLLFCFAFIHPFVARASLSNLPNGGFSARSAANPALAASWSPYGIGYSIDPQILRAGLSSIRCENPTGSATAGAMCAVTLNQAQPTPILLSGWSRARDVAGSPDSDYSLYVDLIYTDGTPLWAQTASFDTGTHGWQQRRLLIVPAKPVRSMNVYALFRNHAGTVWFADFAARELSPNTLFDSQAIRPPVLPGHREGGWFIRDVAANSPIVPVRAGSSALGIFLGRLRLTNKSRVIESEVRNGTARDRAITLYYVERFDTRKAVWWNDIRSAVPVKGGEYANLTAVDVGANGQLSLYPFGCVTGDGNGIALAVPPRLGPRVVRIGYNAHARLLFLACDLALTAKGDPAGHDCATVSIARYNVDPSWGLRDAAAKYFKLFPEAFRRRAAAEGIWMPFTAPQTVQSFGDFHFAYHEGDNSVAQDRKDGIDSFRYVEPMTYWMPMPAGMPRDYADALALLKQQAADTKPADQTARRQAQAVLNSGSEDAAGQFNVAFEDQPWCDGAVWVLDPNPALRHPPGTWTSAMLNQAAEPTGGLPDQPNGEYLDSLEAHADVLDYRPADLAASTLPLTFTPNDYKPTVPTWFSVYEDEAWLSRDLHRHGKLLMANTTPWRFFALTPPLDILGTETGMFSDTGAFAPDADAIMNYRRTLSYHKPYLLLIDTDFRKVSHAGIELYFERCLFYGMYPSMFSADAADNPYWENPALYNRDRGLFETYIPLIQRLSHAGWEPVTWARSNNPRAVWVERFGTQYLTLLNPTDSPAEATITIDLRHMSPGASLGMPVQVRQLPGGVDLRPHDAGGEMSLQIVLQPNEARVIYLAT